MEDIYEIFGEGKTDIIVLYSGGKDSTYTLIKLKETGLFNIHALTFDNGFMKMEAKLNVQRFTSKLDILHSFLRPNESLFQKALSICYENFAEDNKYLSYFKRNGVFCWPCFSFLYEAVYKYASQNNIKYIFGGWNPGQIEEGKHSTMCDGQIPFNEVYHVYVAPFLEFLHYKQLDMKNFTQNINTDMKIVPFFNFEKYDKSLIIDYITAQGWIEPSKCESCTSNCNLNIADRVLYRNQFGYDRYELQIQKMIDHGYSTTNEKSLVHSEVLDKDKAKGIIQSIIQQA